MNIFSLKEENIKLLFGNGHAQGRNVVMYYALAYKMDYLLFWDDDEYPVACIKKQNNIIWSRQDNIFPHIAAMQYADVSVGYHCGYVSPIPCFAVNKGLTESALKRFIGAIGNEIVNWDDIKDKMEKTNGVTFADPSIIKGSSICEIHASGGAKWVAGSTLCLNLRHVEKIPVFYNPPGARGEDTFFSLRLHDLKVLRVPIYHFHDGFLTCRKIMKGVYPKELDKIQMNKTRIRERFFNAALGWLRYKPLFIYLTNHGSYDSIIQETTMNLRRSHEGMSAIFGQRDFDYLTQTFVEYSVDVGKHYQEYALANQIWNRIKEYIVSSSARNNMADSRYINNNGKQSERII